MAKSVKTSYNRGIGHPVVDNRVTTKRAPLIGFEWEVAFNERRLDDSWYDYEYDEYPKLDSFCNRNGFSFHFECNCLEFASPVANTVSVARRVAKKLISFTETHERIFDPYDNNLYDNCGGIHVSVGYPNFRTTREDRGNNHYYRILGMLNRSSSKDFIWQFSGRKLVRSGVYADQAVSSCWDRWGGTVYGPYEDMLRRHRYRFEYRLWGNRGEFLIPAIEFAHSTFIFTEGKEKVPYLREYRDWLFKQKGYKALKNFEHAKWELIQ